MEIIIYIVIGTFIFAYLANKGAKQQIKEMESSDIDYDYSDINYDYEDDYEDDDFDYEENDDEYSDDYNEDSHSPLEINRADLNKISSLKDGQDYFCQGKHIGISLRNGYKHFFIKGMGYQFLQITDVGHFEGYAMTENDNKYDPYAIAIYREDGKHLGYLPRGDWRLHTYITSQGGYVHCMGYVAIYKSGAFFGEVIVEVDKNLVTKRNNPYKTEKYYEYKVGDLKKSLDALQS